MKLRKIQMIFFVCALHTINAQFLHTENTPPNVVIFLADDLGYADLGCYGGMAQTPNLDALAKQGVRFTDFYSAAPNCSPSRTGLLTGRNPSMVGMYSYRPPQHPMHMKDDAFTIAELLKSEGYHTFHSGKWHLGSLGQDTTFHHPQPGDQGFDYSLGTENNALPSHLNPHNFVRNGVDLDTLKGYSCQIVADETINWLESRVDKSKPFFSYIAFHEPHAVVASPPELVKKYAEFSPEDAEYLANVENMDMAVGRVLQYLKDHDLMKNTLILFSSDNGSYRQASNGNLRARKSYVYEGGIRVPGILYWNQIPQGDRLIEEPAGLLDVFPTLQEILMSKPQKETKLDGTSLLPLLQGKNFTRKKPLYWFFYRSSPEIALRYEQYMILGKAHDTFPRTHGFSAPDMDFVKQIEISDYELYDLSNDIGQYENLIEKVDDPAFFQEMIDDCIEEIKRKGFTWTNLPAANAHKKLKTEWAKYTRLEK